MFSSFNIKYRKRAASATWNLETLLIKHLAFTTDTLDPEPKEKRTEYSHHSHAQFSCFLCT